MNLDLSNLPDNAIELKEILFSLFSAWDENEKKYQEKSIIWKSGFVFCKTRFLVERRRN